MSTEILQGDVFDVLPIIEPGSVDCVVTSPPYWMLRSYLPKGHPLKPRELGSEKTPGEYIARMVEVFRLVRETMADHATCWLNIGDSYSAGRRTGAKPPQTIHGGEDYAMMQCRVNGGLEGGNLCLIPQRLAIALQDDGWVVRSVVVWHKPSAMPASLSGWQWRRCRVKVAESGRLSSRGGTLMLETGSGHQPSNIEARPGPKWADCPGCPKCKATDGLVLRRGSWRPTSSWEPILLLAKSANYYADGEAVKTPAASATISRNEYSRIIDDPDEQFAVAHDHETLTTTANLRDVWTIAAEPLKEKHYAAFPTELVHRCLKAGTSARGYCPTCGGPWVRVVDVRNGDTEADRRPKQTAGMNSGSSTLSLGGNGSQQWAERGTAIETLGWRPSCRCPPHEPRPGKVLDPFVGSARTLIEAGRLGLDGIGIDLNPEYTAMAKRLVREESPLFAGID